jgi:hypothetical protein
MFNKSQKQTGKGSQFPQPFEIRAQNGLKKRIKAKKNLGDISLSFSQVKNLKITDHIHLSRREVNLYLMKLKLEFLMGKNEQVNKRKKKKRKKKSYLVQRVAHYVAYYHKFLMKYLRRMKKAGYACEDLMLAGDLKGTLVMKKYDDVGKFFPLCFLL